MKITTRLILVALFLSPFSHAEVKLGSKEVILDNDRVEVVRVTYPVGAQSGVHTHPYPYRTVYFVKGGRLQLTSSNKNEPVKVVNAEDGMILYLAGSSHNVKNIGDSEIIMIETELKP